MLKTIAHDKKEKKDHNSTSSTKGMQGNDIESLGLLIRACYIVMSMCVRQNIKTCEDLRDTITHLMEYITQSTVNACFELKNVEQTPLTLRCYSLVRGL